MGQFFKIQMTVPLGCRVGSLSFEKSGKQEINGTLSLFQHQTPFTGRLTPGGEMTFSGQMITLTKTFPYEARGRVDGKKIKLEVIGDGSRFTISGEEADL